MNATDARSILNPTRSGGGRSILRPDLRRMRFRWPFALSVLSAVALLLALILFYPSTAQGQSAVPDFDWTKGTAVNVTLPDKSGSNYRILHPLSDSERDVPKSLPAGLTFNASSRTITGTPTEYVSGSVYTYAWSESGAFKAERFIIRVANSDGNHPPEIMINAAGTLQMNRWTSYEGSSALYMYCTQWQSQNNKNFRSCNGVQRVLQRPGRRHPDLLGVVNQRQDD